MIKPLADRVVVAVADVELKKAQSLKLKAQSYSSEKN